MEGKGDVTLRVLYDNYACDNALKTDWGFSCLVRGIEKTILFDTGAKGDLLLRVQNVAPTHCTGDKAMGLFKEAFGEGFVKLGVGSLLRFEAANANPVGKTSIGIGEP